VIVINEKENIYLKIDIDEKFDSETIMINNNNCEESVMANITISITKELKEKMSKFPEINWSRLVCILLSQKIKRLELLKELDEILADSKLTEEDCIELGKKLKKEIVKKY
jgi:hypothetical protein